MNEPSDVYGLNNLIYKDEAYDVISCCFEVHKTLGKGFLEAVYKDALIHEFNLKKIPFKREQKFEISYKDIILPHYYCADFILYNKIVLEIKAQQDVIDQHYKQVINYLAVSKLKLGLLVNFGEPSLKFKRIVL
ncbi:MAG: GxxExxY protein [Bacteroidetes bacterium]|nr:GxxExxY protein [Bacteroidota bacterium]